MSRRGRSHTRQNRGGRHNNRTLSRTKLTYRHLYLL